DRSVAGDAMSQYHVEAGIAARHAAAASWGEAHWCEILSLYDTPAAMKSSPRCALNRAVGRSRVHWPRGAVQRSPRLPHRPALARYHLLPAALAELWREAGDPARAAAYYHDALARVRLPAERRFLAARLDGL